MSLALISQLRRRPFLEHSIVEEVVKPSLVSYSSSLLACSASLVDFDHFLESVNR